MWNPYNQLGNQNGGNPGIFSQFQIGDNTNIPMQNAYDHEVQRIQIQRLQIELHTEKSRAAQSKASLEQKCGMLRDLVNSKQAQLEREKSKAAELSTWKKKCQDLEKELVEFRNQSNQQDTVRKLESEVKEWKRKFESKNHAHIHYRKRFEDRDLKNEFKMKKFFQERDLKRKEDLELQELTWRAQNWDELAQKFEQHSSKKLDGNKLIAEYDSLKKTCSSRLDNIKEQKKNLRTAKTEINQLKLKLREKEKVIKQFKKIKANTTITINSSEENSEQIKLLETQLKDTNCTLNKLNTINENMNEKYSLQNNQIYSLKSQNKFYEQKLEKLQEYFTTIQGKLNETFLVEVMDEQDAVETIS